MDFNESGDDGVAVASFAPRSRQITMPTPHHSTFYRPDDAFPHTQPSVKFTKQQGVPKTKN